MTLHDVYLLSPEISVVVLAMIVLLADMVVNRKEVLAALAIVGLSVPLTLAMVLWADLPDQGAAELPGIFGTLMVDRFSLFFKFLLVGIAALVILVSTDYVKKFERFQAEYYALVLFSTSGMLLLASATELITIYVALELTALPIAALAAFLRDGRSAESGLKFLILSAISSAILLYGMVLVYGFTGTTVLDEIIVRIQELSIGADQPFGSYALLLGLILMIGGFGFKIAIVPFQMWAPDVYEGSPTPITAFLSVGSKAAGFAVLLRVFYTAFSTDALVTEWSAIFAVLSALSMSVGNLVAIAQTNIKRMLAYSTVAHAGYLLVGLAAVVSLGTGEDSLVGPSGVLFYLGGYAATNLAAFSVVIAISNRVGSDMIADYAGMGRRSPYMAAVLAFALVSLIGLPPTVGFMAKIYIFGAAVNADLEWLVLVGVVNSVVSAYYYLRVVKTMYLATPASDAPVPFGLPEGAAVATTVAMIGLFGIYPTPLLNFARSAAAALL